MKHDPQTPGHAPDHRPMHEQPRWRQDFPIDVPQDDYVARRDFTKFMVLTSLAFFVGQLWIAVQNMIRRGRGQPPVMRIAAVDDMQIGQAITFNYPGPHDPCLLMRTDENTFLAYSQKCTHLQCGVIPQFEQQRLNCPCHNAYFDLPTGRPIAGPPSRPLPRIVLEIRHQHLYATDVELRTV